MTTSRTGRWTESEFLALPESLEKIELIDGDVVMTPSPTAGHQLILQRLLVDLVQWSRAIDGPVTVGQSPWDIRFAPGRILQPDIFVLFDQVPLDYEGPLDRVPELCVEIVSTNHGHDRVTKRRLYAEAGVREYWVVDHGVIERLTGPDLADTDELRDVLRTPLLPGFELAIPDLFV